VRSGSSIAGHIDTVPINGNVPTATSTIDGEPICGARHRRHEGRVSPCS
jgi:hypothetical protein